MSKQGQLITPEQESLTIQQDEHLALVPPAYPSPLSILTLAVEKGAGIETIERLVALHNQMEEREAKASFDEAMNAAQREMEPIRTNADNPQTRSRYATYKAIDKIIRPIYTRHGFSLSFNTEESPAETVKIVCYVARGKYERKYQIVMPADGKGAKGGDVMTKTHATGAANSYGKRYLLCDIFNIVIGDNDNDGNSGAYGDLGEQLEWIANAKDRDELRRIFQSAYESAEKVSDKDAMLALIKAKNTRYKELSA